MNNPTLDEEFVAVVVVDNDVVVVVGGIEFVVVGAEAVAIKMGNKN